MISRRAQLTGMVAFSVGPARRASAQAYPSRVIKVIVPFAAPGYGTPPHMIGEMFKQRAGIDVVHGPYKGTAASITDMMAGQVQFAFENPSVLIQLIRDGKLRGLATTGEIRNPQAPELPS